MYKSDVRNEAKRLRAITFAIAKLEEPKQNGKQWRKV